MKRSVHFFYSLFILLSSAPVFSQVSTQPGNALGLNGSGQYVKVNNDVAFETTNTTVEAWVKPQWVSGTPTGYPAIVGMSKPGVSRYDIYINKDYSGVIVWNNSANLSYPYAFTQNQTYHIALVFGASSSTLYVNGVPVTTVSATLNGSGTGAPLYIGSSDGTKEYFNGVIDEVRIWNIGRTAQQICENMHLTLSSSETGLVSYYQFNESSGSTTTDVKSGFTGTLNGTPSRPASTFPFGGGASITMTEATGVVNFAGTNLTANYATSGGASTVSSLINTAQPNIVPAGAAVNSVYSNQYWVWNRFGGTAYNTSLVFKTTEDLTASDASNPGGIQLYGRPSASDGNWNLVAAASAVDASLDQATFPGITGSFGQYILVKGKTITTSTPSAPICGGSVKSIPYDGTGITFNAGNTFTVQLSDANGSFNTPQNIGTLSSTASTGSINATLPVSSGTKYRLRVTSDNPVITGLDNGTDVSLVDPIVNSVVSGLTTGLAGFYKLDGNANDSGTNGYNGTIAGGVTTVADHLGTSTGAMSFNGTNSGIDVGNAANLRMYGSLSITAWINISAYPSSQSVMVTKYYNSESYRFFIDNGGHINLTEGATTVVQTAGTVPLNQWVHVTGTTTSGNWKLYVNGKQVGSSAATQSFLDSGGSFQIGKDGTSNRFAGSMDELRIYNRVITATEVQVLYNDGTAFNDSPVCQSGTVTLGSLAITGSPAFSWTGPNGFTSNAQNPPAFTNAAANLSGIYSLVVTNNGCASVPQKTLVSVVASPAVPGVTDGARCSNGTVTLTASGGTNGNYRWYTVSSGGSPIGGQSNSTYTTGSLTVTTPYWVSILNSSGCEGPRAQINAIINTPIDVTLSVSASSPVCSSASSSVSITASESTATYQIFKGTTAVSSSVSGGGTISIPVPASNLTAGANALKITVTKPGCGSADLTNTVSVTVNIPPAITTQPAGQSKCTGDNVSFSVTATGTGLTYQWRIGTTNLNNGGAISGATSATLTITALALGDAGNYNCVVTGTCTPVATSNNASLAIVSVTNISSPPANNTKCAGQSASFSVTASAPGSTLSYQWRKGTTNLSNGGNISGATSSTLTLAAVSTADAGNYNCVISGGCNSVTSADGTLTVNTLPSITAQPGDDTRCAGANSSFTINATGSGITYQWRKGTTNLTNVGNISGATSATLTVSNVAAGDAGSYNCVVSGICAPAVTSNNGTLAIGMGVSITSQPASDTKCVGAGVSFGLTATGAGLTYQWRKGTSNLNNGGNISGATTSILTLSNLAVADGGNYNCVVSSACGSPATSNDATLTINTPPSITSHPANDAKCAGSNASFSAIATGTGLTYQWRKGNINLSDGGVISGSNTSSLTLANISASEAGSYNCVVSGACGPSATSNDATLTVMSQPAITSHPANQIRSAGQSVFFSVLATGATGYQWRKGTSNLNDGGPLTGTTTANLTIANLAVVDGGDYNCIVTNNCGQVISSSGTLTVNKGIPAITFTSPKLEGIEGDQLIISASSGSPASIGFSITGGTGLGNFVDANTLKLEKAGTLKVTALQASNSDFEAASAVQLITVNPDLVTGLMPWSDYNSIQFFPNPAQSIIRVTGISAQDEIMLIDQKGIIIKQWTVNIRTTDLNIEGVPPGLYVIKSYKDKKELVAQRILTY